MSSGFICAVAGVRIPFSSKAENYSMGGMDHILFIRSSISGHLGCFHILAIIRNAAGSVCIRISVREPCFQFFWVYPQEENCWSIRLL